LKSFLQSDMVAAAHSQEQVFTINQISAG